MIKTLLATRMRNDVFLRSCPKPWYMDLGPTQLERNGVYFGTGHIFTSQSWLLVPFFPVQTVLSFFWWSGVERVRYISGACEESIQPQIGMRLVPPTIMMDFISFRLSQ